MCTNYSSTTDVSAPPSEHEPRGHHHHESQNQCGGGGESQFKSLLHAIESLSGGQRGQMGNHQQFGSYGQTYGAGVGGLSSALGGRMSRFF
jgi:hypothetical protein